MFCLVDDKGVIYKPEPKGRGGRRKGLVLSLTFLSDLMKQLQYGCQQKLVNVFIMTLLCFSTSSFIGHIYRQR